MSSGLPRRLEKKRSENGQEKTYQKLGTSTRTRSRFTSF